MNKPNHHVAIALVHHAGRWLVAKRLRNAHLGGLWEFPGGKLHADETPAQAAVRELHEECGVAAGVERVLEPVVSEHPECVLRITPVVCRWRAGEPQAIGNDACGWVSPAELRALPMPPINAQIIRAAIGDVDAPQSAREHRDRPTST